MLVLLNCLNQYNIKYKIAHNFFSSYWFHLTLEVVPKCLIAFYLFWFFILCMNYLGFCVTCLIFLFVKFWFVFITFILWIFLFRWHLFVTFLFFLRHKCYFYFLLSRHCSFIVVYYIVCLNGKHYNLL